MFTLTEQELGGLREEEEDQTDQETGASTGQCEPAPGGPGQLVRDDGPGQARPATIQKVANTLSAPPRLLLGWNSAKYVHTSGMLPPTLKWRWRIYNLYL